MDSPTYLESTLTGFRLYQTGSKSSLKILAGKKNYSSLALHKLRAKRTAPYGLASPFSQLYITERIREWNMFCDLKMDWMIPEILVNKYWNSHFKQYIEFYLYTCNISWINIKIQIYTPIRKAEIINYYKQTVNL